MKRQFLILLFCVIWGLSVKAQNKDTSLVSVPDTLETTIQTTDLEIMSVDPTEYAGIEQNIIPPSPTAASLGRYGEIPVSMFSGTPSIEIPLFELEGTKLSLPISISYQANGVKVEEIPGWVGLGWALNAGGVITRTVNNIADETPDYGYIDFSDNLPASFESASCDFLNEIANGNDGFIDDTEPDVFFYNIPGMSGKFVLGNDANAKLIPFQKLDIQKQLGTLGGVYGITNFTIKTPDGTKYEFGGSGAVEKSTSQRPGPDPGPFYSSWYLTRIVSSDLKDTIKFTYVGHTFVNDAQTTHSPECPNGCLLRWSCETLSSSVTNTTISGVSLSSIESKKGKITLSNSSRSDCNGGVKLTSISLYSKGASYPFKSCTFSYTDVASSPSAPGYVGLRMFLDNVTAKDSTGTNINKHTFSYINRTSLPPRTSNAQDHWGFYNGANSNSSLIPASSLYGLSGADRQPNESYIQNGLLEKITYPTGGYSQFVYEAHKNSTTLLCGGVRIKEIHNYDGTTLSKKKFTYGTGYLFSPVPEYEYTIAYYDRGWCDRLYRQSFNHSVLGTSNGRYVRYPNVTEWIGLSGEGGKTERTFSDYQDSGSSSFPFSPTTSFDWARGLLLNEKHYSYSSGSFTLVEETIYNYGDITGNSQNSYSVKGLKVGYDKFEMGAPLNTPCKDFFSIQRYQEYFYHSRWFYLKEKTKKSYLTGGTVTENTKYYYTNPTHAQLTKKTDGTSIANDSICTFYYYPDDYPTLFQTLKTNFIIGKPIDVRTYNNSQLIAGQQFEYNDYGMPVKIYKAWVSQGDVINFNSGTPYTFTPFLDIIYNVSYNLSQITPVNNYPITYLWSYDDTYPVMKIENATFNQVSSLAGSTLIEGLRKSTIQSDINTKLAQIRTNLSSISNSTLITSYTYRRHIGISEVGDPTNIKTRYSYNKFGRLNYIKNDDNNLLNQYLYNYINK